MGRKKHKHSRDSNIRNAYFERNFNRTKGKSSWKKKSHQAWRTQRECKFSDASPSTSRLSGSSPSTSSSTHHASDKESEIPGFYFDKEKKAYFKILPNTMSTVSSFVTKESIKKKEDEARRLSDMEKLVRGQSAILRSALFSPIEGPSQNNGLTEVLKKLQCGQVTCENFRTYMNRHRCITLQPATEIINSRFNRNSMKLDELQKMLTTATRDRLVCVWSLKSSIAQCIQLLSVSSNLSPYSSKQERTEATESSSIVKSFKMTEPIFKKISSICWASFPAFPGTHTVLYTATCPVGYSPTIVYALNLDAIASACPVSIFELNLGFNTVWSCAWHNFNSKFSVGAEGECLLIDVATRRTWTYYTHNSDPLAQTFSPTDPHKMYNGTRKGSILVHDIRCPGRSRSQQEMRQKHGISCLKLLRDENYILASDFSGVILNWDQRMNRVIKRYEGLVNSHYQLPFHLDELESVLCGAGSDSYTKLWDVRSGNLLQSIPPPCPASQDSFPVAMYAQRWGNSDGNSGLLMGVRNRLKIYC
ncbi:Ddb1- and cul4-associated factor 4-like [Plakobranchus ocellatus]|uniref:Ddb1- and cul4-associated factor 4-like n=1 Tax=Plakobranchus ocellatus TaxID=259542 RepID=A0AAV4CFM9_9GAST|nr:Ddb1- and cul4-associated factor 4-like [Plakobranchus ocellatus]